MRIEDCTNGPETRNKVRCLICVFMSMKPQHVFVCRDFFGEMLNFSDALQDTMFTLV